MSKKKPLPSARARHPVGTTIKLSDEHRALLAGGEAVVFDAKSRVNAAVEELVGARIALNVTMQMVGEKLGLLSGNEDWLFDSRAGTATRKR